MSRLFSALLLAVTCAAHAAAPAQRPETLAVDLEPSPDATIVELSPAVIDTQDGEGATLGLEFIAKGTLLSRDFSTDDASDDLDFNTQLSELQLGYEAKGVVAADQARNPKDFLTARLDLSYLFQREFGAFAGGGFIAYEADQAFDGKQTFYGARLTYAKMNMPFQNDIFAVDVDRGRVDPADDAERSAALGVTALERYYRTGVEALYIHTIAWRFVQTLEFNYRYFRESNPPAAATVAGIDRHQLITYRMGLPKDFFVAYSTGKLPLDRKNDRMFEIGLSYRLQ